MNQKEKSIMISKYPEEKDFDWFVKNEFLILKNKMESVKEAVKVRRLKERKQ